VVASGNNEKEQEKHKISETTEVMVASVGGERAGFREEQVWWLREARVGNPEHTTGLDRVVRNAGIPTVLHMYTLLSP
jgi:hypothetical protein